MAATDNYGLNKERRNAALRDKGAAANLEPPFPWDVLGFDNVFFGAEPSDVDEEKKG